MWHPKAYPKPPRCPNQPQLRALVVLIPQHASRYHYSTSTTNSYRLAFSEKTVWGDSFCANVLLTSSLREARVRGNGKKGKEGGREVSRSYHADHGFRTNIAGCPVLWDISRESKWNDCISEQSIRRRNDRQISADICLSPVFHYWNLIPCGIHFSIFPAVLPSLSQLPRGSQSLIGSCLASVQTWWSVVSPSCAWGLPSQCWWQWP